MIPRILFYDIETTDLDADFGNMIAFGYKMGPATRPTVLSLLTYAKPCRSCHRVAAVSDRALVAGAAKVLRDADLWVTWYGKQFDLRFVNTRLLDAGLPPLPPVPHIDLYWTARMHLKLSSNRLASVQDFLQLPAKKTPLTKRVWRQAQAGHVQSIKYIMEHCARDVDVLDQAYEKLRPLVRQHPRLFEHGRCLVCGSPSLQRYGVRVSVTRGPQVRFRCSACGHYEQRAAKRGEA